MLRPKSFQSLSAIALTIGFSSNCLAQEKPRLDFRPGEVIVGYYSGADRKASEAKLKSASILNSFGLLGSQKVQKIEIKPFKDTALLVKFTLPAGQNAFASDDRDSQRRLIDDLADQIKKADPKVKYVYPNYLMQIPEQKRSPTTESQLQKRLSAVFRTSATPPGGFPDDPQFASGLQWNFQALPRGMNAVAAWRVTTGDRKVVVAVLDSGILRAHPDIAGSGNLLPGYNFVSDGPGRSDDPADNNNIFHGSHVASLVGAGASNNKVNIAGINWAVSVLPIRVANEAGQASTKDLAEAILWAAGVPVEGVPKNETPADVINLSLAREAPCSEVAPIRAAVEKARAAGAVIVVAAGNSSKDVAGFTPAGCPGVISVAAADVNGRLASYSNYGNISIVAPGGEDAIPVLGISDGGTAGHAGTSFAAPHVAGAIALALASHDQWRRNPDLIAAAIRDTAVPMQTGACTRPCGPGQLDALRLLEYQPAIPGKPIAVAKSPSPATPAAVTSAKLKLASTNDISGRWLMAEGSALVISNEEWVHPSKGTATLSRASQNQLVVRYPQQTGVTCSYRATLIEDGAAIRLDPSNASQPDDFCPSGRLPSTPIATTVQSKAAKVAAEAPSSGMLGRWLLADTSAILVIEKGQWIHPTKGAGEFASSSNDVLVVQYPQPASARCAYRVAVLDGGKVLQLIATNALQPDDFCPSGRLIAAR